MRRAQAMMPAVGMQQVMMMQKQHLSQQNRQDLSRTVTRVKEEAKGQSLDLGEMNDASRRVMKSLQDTVHMMPPSLDEDVALMGKLKTLNTSLKAYNGRLANLQAEARALHSDAEVTMKQIWGNAPPSTGSSSAPSGNDTGASSSAADNAKEGGEEDFTADVPPVAEKLNKMNEQREETVVEAVEPEVVSSSSGSKRGGAESQEEEIEIEIESPDEVDEMPIADITKELHERGIDFGDCKDAKSLRKRYRDMRDGKFNKAQSPPSHQQQQYAPPSPPKQEPSAYQQRSSQQQQQPATGSFANGNQQQNYYQQQKPNTQDTGVIPDPHPNAQRRMLDPMKHVWEVKMDLAKENNVPVDQIDLWAGLTRLEDHKRMNEYPQAQYNMIEVRRKGDPPAGAHA